SRVLLDELGVAVIDEPRCRNGIRLLLCIRRARGRREYLHLHLGLVHLLQACLDARRVVRPPRPACCKRPRCLWQATPADAHEEVVVRLRKVVGMDIDDHRHLPEKTRTARWHTRPLLPSCTNSTATPSILPEEWRESTPGM